MKINIHFLHTVTGTLQTHLSGSLAPMYHIGKFSENTLSTERSLQFPDLPLRSTTLWRGRGCQGTELPRHTLAIRYREHKNKSSGWNKMGSGAFPMRPQRSPFLPPLVPASQWGLARSTNGSTSTSGRYPVMATTLLLHKLELWASRGPAVGLPVGPRHPCMKRESGTCQWSR